MDIDRYGDAYTSTMIDPYAYGWNYNPYAFDGDWSKWFDEHKDADNKSFSSLSTASQNLYLNERQNALDLYKWRAQNAWDLDMWNLSNEYNSPAAQMDRLVQAGINPIQSLGSAASGNAQALQSHAPSSSSPLAGSMEDQELAQDYLKFVQSNALNSTLGFSKLNIEQQKADTAAKVGDSEARRNDKQANYLESIAEGQRISNDWDLQSFDVRLEEEAEKLNSISAQVDELKSRKDLNEEEVKELQEKERLYQAEQDFAREKINDIKASIRQRDEQIKINWFTAHSGRIQANASASLAKTAAGQLELDTNRLTAEVQKWNNDQLLTYMRSFGREFEVKGRGRFGTKNNYVEGSGSWSGAMPAPKKDYPLKAIVVCNEVVNRASKNPSSKALREAAEADRLMKALAKVYDMPAPPSQDLHFTPVSTAVQNPVYGLDDSW